MATQPTYRIVVTSNEPWGEVWFSKQHIAYALAQLGHEVYFLNAPQGWSPKHWWAPRWEVRPVEERLWVVDYDNPYPLRGHKRLMLWLNDRWVGQQLKTLLGDDRPVPLLHIPAASIARTKHMGKQSYKPKKSIS